MLTVARNHGSMGRMFSASVVARSMASRLNLPVPTPASASSSSSSESCYSSVGESEAWESSRAELAQRMAPPHRTGIVSIVTTNTLSLPWTQSSSPPPPLPQQQPQSSTTTITVPPAPPKQTPKEKKKKRPGLPVSLNAIAEDFCRGINPVGFVVQTENSSISVPTIPIPTPPGGNGYERARVQAMLTEQRTNSPSSSSSSSSSSPSSADEDLSSSGKRDRITSKKSTASSHKRRKTSASSSSSSSSADELRSSSGKRNRITSKKSTSSSHKRSETLGSASRSSRSTGNPSSNEDIAENEFFRREGSDNSSSSGSGSSGSDNDSRPNLYRRRRHRKKNNLAEPAEPSSLSAPSANLCFGCMWGHRQFDRVASTKLNRLAEIFDGHFLTSEPRELAHLIHLYYQAEIYLPGSKGGKRFPEWTEDQILIHIEEHILEPRVFVAKSIRKCIKVQRALEMFFFEEDEETHRRTFNEKAMKLWLTFNKRQMDLHNCDCKHMFGYSESMRIDPSQLSRVVHADRYEVTSSNKRGRANVYS